MGEAGDLGAFRSPAAHDGELFFFFEQLSLDWTLLTDGISGLISYKCAA